MSEIQFIDKLLRENNRARYAVMMAIVTAGVHITSKPGHLHHLSTSDKIAIVAIGLTLACTYCGRLFCFLWGIAFGAMLLDWIQRNKAI